MSDEDMDFVWPDAAAGILRDILRPPSSDGPPFTHRFDNPPTEYDDEGNPTGPLVTPSFTVTSTAPVPFERLDRDAGLHGEFAFRLSVAAVQGIRTVAHPHPGRPCTSDCGPDCAAALRVPVTISFTEAGPAVYGQTFAIPVPDAAPALDFETLARIMARFDDLPPPPEPIKATRGQWNLMRWFIPKAPEPEPWQVNIAQLTGVPVHIVEDVEKSTPWLREWAAPYLEPPTIVWPIIESSPFLTDDWRMP